MPIYPSLIDRLKTQNQAIENIISTLPAGRLVIKPLPGKWNIHENIAHLARYQPVFSDRINQVLIKEEPSFGRYSADEDPAFETYKKRDIGSLLSQLTLDRKGIFDLITNLGDDQQIRIGVHKKYGRLNIIQWTEFFLLHEAHHIFTIFQLANDTEL